jgi:putative oxidoreductase
MPLPIAPLQTPISSLMRLARPIIALLEHWITPLFALGIRVYVAEVFFRSGWLKLTDWSTTLVLFENEYHVPLLSPEVAAVMGTAGELCLPVLLVLGLAGRFGAAGLFVVNAMAVISYPDLVELALKDHHLWGALIAVIIMYGPGRFSVDAWLNRKLS